MADRSDPAGHGGAERREEQTSRYPREVNSSRREHPHRPVVIHTTCPQTIQVEPHKFKEVVQRLTGKEWDQSEMIEEHSAAHVPTSTSPQESPSLSSHHALEEYLDRLDRENPPPQPSFNQGLFPTAGLVKGVNVELGLQWEPGPESVGSFSFRLPESSNRDIECPDRFDKENPPAQPSLDEGLFPTAGLVKGVNLKL